MSLRRKIIVAAALMMFGVVAYIGYGILYTWRHIPEAYAAWDTGTLLVEYMKTPGDRWPSSWDDLLSVTNRVSGDKINLFGVGSHPDYALYLEETIAIDWKFDPTRIGRRSPVTRPDGTRFPIVWGGAEPNEMVRAYLKTSGNTNAPQSRSHDGSDVKR